MIVVEAGHAHVMKFLPLSCELSIFVAVTVIFRCVLTYSHHFDVFYIERQPYILHSVFTPTWTTNIYYNPVHIRLVHIFFPTIVTSFFDPIFLWFVLCSIVSLGSFVKN
jgi:hypothetical protein